MPMNRHTAARGDAEEEKRGGATRQSESDRQQHRRGREKESRGGAEKTAKVGRTEEEKTKKKDKK
jgi:hypothetical protein